jgi:hypothetical protein
VFIPLFALFGVVLHCAYDRTEAFLFSPEYAATGAVALALMLDKVAARVGPLVGILAALGLGAANLQAYRTLLAESRPTSRPLSA